MASKTPKTPREPRKPGITLRLTDQLREAVDKAAEDDHRSVASLAELALIKLLRERGTGRSDQDVIVETRQHIRRHQCGSAGNCQSRGLWLPCSQVSETWTGMGTSIWP